MSTPDILSIANSAVSDLFKTKYLRYMDSHHNKEHPWVAKVEKDTSASGNTQTVQLKFGAIGGYSAGGYKDPGKINYSTATYTLKDLYFRGRIDSKSIELSSDVSGAARKLTEEAILEANRELSRNMERQMVYGDGTGAIGQIASSSGVTDNGGGDYTLTLTTAFVRDNFHDGLLINIGSAADPSLFEIKLGGVNKSSRTVRVLRRSGSDVPANSDYIYMQGSKDNELQGLRGVLKATSGTKYGRSIGPGWQSEQLDAGSDPINPEMLLDVLYNIVHETGKTPSDMLVPMTQWKKLIHLGEASLMKMQYAEAKAGQMSMGNVPHLYLDGVEVPMIRLLTMPASEIFMVNNTSALVNLNSAGEGKFVMSGQSDGYLWYRGQQGTDEYEFFYRKYCEQFIHPTYHGVIHTLSTTTVA
jgi:hypothetical protein